MEAVTLILAVVALVVAIIAFQRTGGIGELRQQVDNLSSKTETVRERTANLLDRFERLVRGRDKAPSNPEKEEDQPDQFTKSE